MYKADKRLKTIYLRYNREAFDGTLPTDTEVGWNDELKDKMYGITLGIADEDTKHLFFQIHVNEELRRWPEVVRLTLLHEMNHIYLYPYMKHGKRFEEAMVRLAGRGMFKGLW